MWVFDVIELNGDDLRRDPLAVRNATLASLVARAAPGLRLNEHLDDDGAHVFGMPAGSGLRASSPSGAIRPIGSVDWIKSKNPAAPAMKREAEEDWGGSSSKPRHSRWEP